MTDTNTGYAVFLFEQAVVGLEDGGDADVHLVLVER